MIVLDEKFRGGRTYKILCWMIRKKTGWGQDLRPRYGGVTQVRAALALLYCGVRVFKCA